MRISVVLSLIFLTLKLLGVISWSWWLVFFPVILSTVLGVAIFLLMLLLGDFRE